MRAELARNLALGLLLLLMGARSGLAASGEISGQVFTGLSSDSLGSGARLTLVYRTPGGDIRHSVDTAGVDGSFCFSELATDPRISYVLQVEHQGHISLGAPFNFPDGQSQLRFDVLAGTGAIPEDGEEAGVDAGPLPPDGMEGDLGLGGGEEGTLPAGHPAIPFASAPAGRPVRDNPAHTVLLTLAVGLLFGMPYLIVSRKDRDRERKRAVRA